MSSTLSLFSIGKKLTALLIAVALIAPPVYIVATEKAHAGGAQLVQEIPGVHYLNQVITGVEQLELTIKDTFLDSIAWILAKVVIQALTVEIVNWINRDFEGYPGFVDNMGVFMEDIADQAFGAYIARENLEFLCNPMDVRIALTLDYHVPRQERYRCTLSAVVENFESFVRGNFQEGGWTGWFTLQKSTSNVIGQYLNISADIQSNIASDQDQQERLLSYGKGFFSDLRFDTCKGIADNISGDIGPGEEGGDTTSTGVGTNDAVDVTYTQGKTTADCRITTPGVIAEEQLAKVLGAPIDGLNMADEINEAIGAIIGALVARVLTDGLNALTSSGRGTGAAGGGSYVDLLQNEVGRQLDTVKENIIAQIDREIEEELALREELQCEAVDGIDDTTTGEGGIPSDFGNGGALTFEEFPEGTQFDIESSTELSSMAVTPSAVLDRFNAERDNNLSIAALINDGLANSSGEWADGATLADLGIERDMLLRNNDGEVQLRYDSDDDGDQETISNVQQNEIGQPVMGNVSADELDVGSQSLAPDFVNEMLENHIRLDRNPVEVLL